jgi:hypothetical protein
VILARFSFQWNLYGFFLSSLSFAASHRFSFISFLFDLKPVSRPDPMPRRCRRAQELSRLAVAPNLATAPAFARPHLGQLRARRHAYCGRDDDVEGKLASYERMQRAQQTCMRSAHSSLGTMMQSCASVSEAPRRRTHSQSRHEGRVPLRGTATSNRHRRPFTNVRTGTENR